MKVRQISIFLENRSGRLASVLREVGRAGVNIRALSLADAAIQRLAAQVNPKITLSVLAAKLG